MKKNLFILAVTAAALASCSNDVTTAVNKTLNAHQEITFRSTTDGMTRAADITTSNLSTIYVTANKSGSPVTNEFGVTTPETFTNDNGTFSSTNKHYWPAAGSLDFIAFAPATGSDINRTDSTQFSVTPNSTPASQVDFVYAVVRNQSKLTSSSGVALNFRHAESRVVIQLKNTSSDYKFTVNDVSLRYIKPTGVFHPVFKTSDGSQVGFSTDGTNVSNITSDAGYYIAPSAWSASGTETNYTQTASTTSYPINTTTPAALADAMILIPQTLTTATQYSAATDGASFNGACISVEMKIQNTSDEYQGGSAAGTFITGIFPLPAIQWLPGHQYTYTVDLAGGGYYLTNHDTDIELDPILENVEIKFINVTVDGWVAVDGN